MISELTFNKIMSNCVRWLRWCNNKSWAEAYNIWGLRRTKFTILRIKELMNKMNISFSSVALLYTAQYRAARFSAAAALKRAARYWAARKRSARDRDQTGQQSVTCVDSVRLCTRKLCYIAKTTARCALYIGYSTIGLILLTPTFTTLCGFDSERI